MKYSELNPGDVIEWKARTDGSGTRLDGPGVIQNFIRDGSDPMGIAVLTNGNHIHRIRIKYKIISNQRIEVDK